MGILPLFVCFTLVTFVLMPVFTLFPFMTLLHFNGNILQMGVVEMGWGSGALLGGLVLACKALKSKQTLVMHTAYVILGLYLISASYLPSSAFYRFCLPNIYRRHSLFHLPCAFHRYYSAELGFGHAWTDFFSHL